MTARRVYVPAAMPSRDPNGRALPAKLRFYDPGTAYSTPATVYADETLATPLAWPVLSDAYGRFPAVWADDAESFDVTYTDQVFDRSLGGPYTNVSPVTDAAAASVALAEAAADAAAQAEAEAEAALRESEAIVKTLEGYTDGAVANATNVNYTAPGTGAVVRSVATKLAERVSVKDYGAKGDAVRSRDGVITGTDTLTDANYSFVAADVGKLLWIDGVQHTVTAVASGSATFAPANTNGTFRYWVCASQDDTAAIQAAIDANPGRRIFLPKGGYAITDTIWLKCDGQMLEGEAGPGYALFLLQENRFATSLIWAGNGGGPVLKVARLDPTTSPYSITAAAVRRLRLDAGEGTSRATVGLYVPDANYCAFEDIKVHNPSSRGIDLTSYVPDISGINSCYHCDFRDISIFVYGSADGIYMGPTANPGGGDHPAFCRFVNLHLSHQNGRAIFIAEADDLIFDVVAITRATSATGDAITLAPTAVGDVCGIHFRCVNAHNDDGVDPLIDVGANCRAIYFELAGVDDQIAPTVASGAECYVMYLGSNSAANTAYFRSPAIQLPNVANSDPLKLDWYEEGAFTPVLSFGGATTGITYSAQTGSFVRIGKLIHVQGRVTITSKGSATGMAALNTVLPYASGSANISVGSVRLVTGFASTDDRGALCQIGASSQNIALVKNVSGVGGTNSMADTDFTNASDFQFSISYLAP